MCLLLLRFTNSDHSLFSTSSKISDLITVIGDVHHIFPKKYLMKNGVAAKKKYNQIANFTYLDTQVNKAIGENPPSLYFKEAFDNLDTDNFTYGNIKDKNELLANLKENCIPEIILDMDYYKYDDFLNQRRKMMAEKIRAYYYSL